jgi:hypothetical protein
MSEDLRACFLLLRKWGYSRNAARRIAVWCCDPSQELNKHHH